MRQVNCRKCHTPQIIKGRHQQEAEYPDDVLCYECWKPKATSHNSVKVTTSKSSGGGWSNKSKKNTKKWAVDSESGLEVSCKYEVGDSVFINSDEYGVLLCQIVDSEAWGVEHIFYTLDIKGTIVDYVEESSLYDTAVEAHNSIAETF